MLVRTDLPLADQVVQVGHACLEAGRRFAQPAAASHLVVLAVASRPRLYDALTHLDRAGILYVAFFEPDRALGYTAACTEPLIDDARRDFRRFALWRER